MPSSSRLISVGPAHFRANSDRVIAFPSNRSSWIGERFELLALIGQGGLGDVYRAWDHRLSRNVAVKRMRTNELPRTDRQLAEQTWREAMTTSCLQHPNIVTIFDYGLDQGGAYVVMELLEGETLEEVLLRGPLQYEDFLRFAQQTLEAIVAAHAIGLIHRDLKPSNFMITRYSSDSRFHVKILDFGLAKILDAPRPQSTDHFNSLMGSIHYMAPEQFMQQPVSARTDLYSLGCIFYEVVTGHAAFQGETISELIDSHLRNALYPMRRLRRDLSGTLERWVMDFLLLEPERRHASAAEALASLPRVNECRRDRRNNTTNILKVLVPPWRHPTD